MSESLAHNQSDPHGLFSLEPLPRALRDWGRTAGLAGAISLVLLLVFSLFEPQNAFRSLLFGFNYWLWISLGSLGFVMISHLTGGGWGAVMRRIGEASFLNIPLMLVFFLILSLGYKYLFPWAHIQDFAGDKVAYPVLQHRVPLFAPGIFFLRNLLYFGIWIALAVSLRIGSLQLDLGPDLVLRRKMRKISAAGVVLFFITTTGYAFDYILSRETNWFSSIIGFITAVSIGAAGMAFISLVVCYFADKKPIKDVLTPQHLNDFGNILLALVILWMYTSFAQFLIQWNGAMPEDTQYYIARGIGATDRNGWQYIALLLLIGNFFVPFFLLLMKGLKRSPVAFAGIVGWLLFMRFVDGLWLFGPSGAHRLGVNGHPDPSRIYFTDLLAFVGIGGIWISRFIKILGTKPMLARNVADEPEMVTHGTLAQTNPA